MRTTDNIINQLMIMKYAPHTFKLFLNKLIKTNLENWEEYSLEQLESWLETYILENINKEAKLQQNIEYLNIYGVINCFETLKIDVTQETINVDLFKNGELLLGYELPNNFELSALPTQYFNDKSFYKLCVPESINSYSCYKNYVMQWFSLLFVLETFSIGNKNIILNLEITGFKLEPKDINKLNIIYKNVILNIKN